MRTKLTPETGQHNPLDRTGSLAGSHTDSLTYYTAQFNANLQLTFSTKLRHFLPPQNCT